MSLFYMLMITHSLCFIAMIASSVAKKLKFGEIVFEFFRNVICSFLYISIIIYCIFKDRLVEDDYTVSVTNDRVQQWILFEIGTFFGWIFASVLFLQFIYWSKFTSVWKKNQQRVNLDYIWNHKNTRDVAHYMKFEHDLFCLINSDICLHIFTIIIFKDEFTRLRDYLHYALIITFRLIMLWGTHRHLTT